jgi:cell division protein FtsL
MEEGFSQILKILFIIMVAIVLILAIYFLKDVLYEKTSSIKDIFSSFYS